MILADRGGERVRPQQQLREIDCGGGTSGGRFWQFSSDSAIAAQKEGHGNGRGRFGKGDRKGDFARGGRKGEGDDPVL